MLVDRHGDGASALLEMMNDHCNQASFFSVESIGMAQSGIDHWLRCWRCSSGSAFIVVDACWSCCSRCCANWTTSPGWMSCAIFIPHQYCITKLQRYQTAVPFLANRRMDDGAILGCFLVAHEKPERPRTRAHTLNVRMPLH